MMDLVRPDLVPNIFPHESSLNYPLGQPEWLFKREGDEVLIIRRERLQFIEFSGCTWMIEHWRLRHPAGVWRNQLHIVLVADYEQTSQSHQDEQVSPRAVLFREGCNLVCGQRPQKYPYSAFGWDQLASELVPLAIEVWTKPYTMPPMIAPAGVGMVYPN